MDRIPGALKAAAPRRRQRQRHRNRTAAEQHRWWRERAERPARDRDRHGRALVILALVYGSALAVVPLLMAIPSILITFLLVGGLTHLTDVSFLMQFLVALIGLGVRDRLLAACRDALARRA